MLPKLFIKPNASQNVLNTSADAAIVEKGESLNKIKALFNNFKHKHDMIFAKVNDKQLTKPLIMTLELDRIKEK